jgi:hypothetical protein
MWYNTGMKYKVYISEEVTRTWEPIEANSHAEAIRKAFANYAAGVVDWQEFTEEVAEPLDEETE